MPSKLSLSSLSITLLKYRLYKDKYFVVKELLNYWSQDIEWSSLDIQSDYLLYLCMYACTYECTWA